MVILISKTLFSLELWGEVGIALLKNGCIVFAASVAYILGKVSAAQHLTESRNSLAPYGITLGCVGFFSALIGLFGDLTFQIETFLTLLIPAFIGVLDAKYHLFLRE